jgi:hypothetical protein
MSMYEYFYRHITSDDDRAAALTHCISSLCGFEYRVKLNEPRSRAELSCRLQQLGLTCRCAVDAGLIVAYSASHDHRVSDSAAHFRIVGVADDKVCDSHLSGCFSHFAALKCS